MVTIETITFERRDETPEYIVESLKDIANHFMVKRPYVPDFLTIISTSSSWNIINIEQKLNVWKTRFNIDKGRYKIIQLVEKAFKTCQNKDDLLTLRGGLVEALVLGFHGGTKLIESNNFGWGSYVKVKDPDKPKFIVRYTCNLLHAIDDGSDCKDRATVDFGYWTGKHGKFIECKTYPELIGCSEIKYMERLSDTLLNRNIKHEIMFIYALSSENIEQTLDDLVDKSRFRVLSIKELERKLLA